MWLCVIWHQISYRLSKTIELNSNELHEFHPWTRRKILSSQHYTSRWYTILQCTRSINDSTVIFFFLSAWEEFNFHATHFDGVRNDIQTASSHTMPKYQWNNRRIVNTRFNFNWIITFICGYETKKPTLFRSCVAQFVSLTHIRSEEIDSLKSFQSNHYEFQSKARAHITNIMIT